MKQRIKKTILVKKLIHLRNKYLYKKNFVNSKKYWISRYEAGESSGAGSYNNLAEFKSSIINRFVAEKGIKRAIEFGCGDGNQLKYFNIPKYIGFDISTLVIEKCKRNYNNDNTKEFYHIDYASNYKADLILSLDVIYHLVEDKVFHNHMNQLFKSSTKYVIIYSSNFKNKKDFSAHVRHRIFTNWISKYRIDFQLIEEIPNEFPFNKENESSTSYANFYIYKKIV